MITPDTIKHRSISTFLDAASSKFDKGQAEHGGLLTDRNCFKEMKAEIIDLWHYYSAEEMRREGQERYISELESEVLRLRSLIGDSNLIAGLTSTSENGAATTVNGCHSNGVAA